ncbi:hypothetical protein R6Q59_003510 [Mikania micrantha]
MALAKERNPNDHSSHMSGLVHQSCKFYETSNSEFEEIGSSKKKGYLARSSSNSSSLSSLGSATNYLQQLHQEEEIDERPYASNLSLDQLMNLGSGSFHSMHLLESINSFQSGGVKENLHHDELESFAWPNPSSSVNYFATQESSFHKRAHSSNCRERISERLKVLQDLVPNGSKVDLVTMLEKAISYVKFLQLQVKVLAADEFWPVQGGKPPKLSQVKDAIDALLSSSQRDRTIHRVTLDIVLNARRVGGLTHQVPIEIGSTQAKTLVIRWLLAASQKCSGRNMALKLSSTLVDAVKGSTGDDIRKREETHRMT